MIDYRTDALIADIKRHGSIPTNQQLLTAQDFIDFLNHNQRIYLVPAVLRAKEEFFVSTYQVALNNQLVEQAYALPTRAIGHRVRKVILVDNQGNEVMLPRIEPENKTWHETFAWWPGTKCGYYFEGNKIVLTPNLNQSFNFLRIKYYRRPNWLVANSKAATITSIDTGTGELGVDAIPSEFTTSSKLDFINPIPTFDSRADSVAVISIDTGAPSITVAPATAALLSVGDYITLEGESIVPQYPEELYPLLTQLALVDSLKALGDSEGLAAATSDLEEMERSLGTLIDDRDDGSPRKVVTRRGLWDTGGI